MLSMSRIAYCSERKPRIKSPRVYFVDDEGEFGRILHMKFSAACLFATYSREKNIGTGLLIVPTEDFRLISTSQRFYEVCIIRVVGCSMQPCRSPHQLVLSSQNWNKTEKEGIVAKIY